MTLDTNLHYCRRLAEELLKPPPLDPLPLFDLDVEIRRQFKDLPKLVDEDTLTEQLKDNPKAQAELAVLSEYTPSKWLLERELEAQGLWVWPVTPGGLESALPSQDESAPDGYDEARSGDGMNARQYAPDAYRIAADQQTMALCFSGGGIRSATFNLGVLQVLAATRRLEQVTYLSSVSGGGYIHQFLATWIYNRSVSRAAVLANLSGTATGAPPPKKRTPLQEVEELMQPLPDSPQAGRRTSHGTLAAQPLRWLARYSNYLAPRKGLIGLDTWTIFAVWLRNTLLNLVVLLSSFITLLLLPHIPITKWIVYHSASLPAQGSFDIGVAVAMFLCFFVPGWKISQWVRYSDCPPKHSPPFWHILTLILVLFLAACIAAPAVYRSSLPNELSYLPASATDPSLLLNPVFKEPDSGIAQMRYSAQFQQHTDKHAPDTLTVDAVSHADLPVSRLRTHWKERPVSFLPHPVKWEAFRLSHLRSWIPANSFPATRIAFVLGNAAALLLLGFGAKDETPDSVEEASTFQAAEQARRRRRASGVRWWAYPILLIVGIAFSWLLLFGVRTLFFVAAFSVRPELVSSLGVVLLPTLLFGVPFIVLELGVGLVGDALTDEKREWIARLRAASFLTGGAWLVLTSFSLLGPELFDWIAKTTASRWTVWAAWLGTTIVGVLAGKSSRTAGPADPEENASKTSIILQAVTAIAPPVFIAGMLLIVAKLTNWSIASVPTPDVEPARLLTVLLAILAFAVIYGAFGWRININDFSLHSFYRDRLARCYAGASNPHRQPNSFTGFAPTDRKLPVAALLGTKWRHAPGAEPAGPQAYTGPFPIICTAVNLTTGEDLAYQERKAASFVFTPLYSGFDVGRTAGTDKRVQFNGFVPTAEYVYTDHGGISLATAVAISGAAASPNMGYHSSPAMAFLMTVFNVRLGWWLRNPRRRLQRIEDETETPAKLPPSVPRFGPLRLLDELFGQANDSAAYIYLTDGGHFDNMGLYELIRRRCRRIIVCDSEADAALHFEGIGMAIRKARLDFGVEITLDGVDREWADAKAKKEQPREPANNGTKEGKAADGDPRNTALEPDKAEAPGTVLPAQPLTVHFETQTSESGQVGVTGEIASAQPTASEMHGLDSFKPYPGNATHAVFGTIRYPEAPDQLGHILYIKSSLTGDEPADVLNFRREHNTFPHDTTLNQFFTESQFESYRRLGQHILEEDATVKGWLEYFLPV